MLWQRAAGGFSAGQQRELAQRVMAELGLAGRKARGVNPQIERESWRLLASLERLDAYAREDRRRAHATPAPRCAQRQPALGDRSPRRADADLRSAEQRRAASDAGRWLEQLLATGRESPDLAAAVVQIGALTGDAARDLDRRVVDAARQRLREANVDPGAVRPLYEVVTATFADTSRAFGEPLPNGLQLRTDSGSREPDDQGHRPGPGG